MKLQGGRDLRIWLVGGQAVGPPGGLAAGQLGGLEGTPMRIVHYLRVAPPPRKRGVVKAI